VATAAAGPSTLDVLTDIGTAGVDAGVDIYYTVSREHTAPLCTPPTKCSLRYAPPTRTGLQCNPTTWVVANESPERAVCCMPYKCDRVRTNVRCNPLRAAATQGGRRGGTGSDNECGRRRRAPQGAGVRSQSQRCTAEIPAGVMSVIRADVSKPMWTGGGRRCPCGWRHGTEPWQRCLQHVHGRRGR
jgi:hypothetical protein